MKLSKTNKILLLFATFIICLAISCSFAVSSAKADGAETYAVSSTAFKVVDTESEHTITLAMGRQYKKTDLVIKKTVDGTETTVKFDELTGLTPTLENDTCFAYESEVVETFVLGGTTYTVKVVKDIFEPAYAPKYINVADPYLGEKEALEEKLALNVRDSALNCYKPIGSGKYITIPSFDKYVTDETTLYQNMKYKVYYKVNATDTTTTALTVGKNESDFKIPVKEAGTYTFYVAFIDSVGNEMKIEDEALKEKLTLSFFIGDDYPVKVEIGENHGAEETAYLNNTYKGTSSLFKYTGVTTKEFTLSYSENNEENSFKDLTEEEIKAVEFNKSDLSFKPNKNGYYKITCEGKNESGLAVDTNEVVINVTDKPAEAETQEETTSFWDWVSDHVLSVVFFCIAFVCLVVIIVLLCIKPKTDNTSDDSNK